MTAAGTPLLACRNLSKHFGALAAVDNLSFDVAAGEVLGIGGPNGAGKTTLFEVISGMNPASAGEVLFEGRPITRLSPERICHAGIARSFQLNAAFDSLTVAENVAVAAYFGRHNRVAPGLALDSETRRRTEAALETVGLAAKRNEIARRLPVLDRKLLMLAGALATGPKLLLLDEPVGGLNPGEIDHVVAIVEGLCAGGITILLIEHVMRFLVRLSSRVLIMHHGEKIYEGSAAGLVRDATVVDVYLGAGASARLSAALETQA
jgi:branched-chain amino acid transport system ATP-binding protein